MKTKLFEVRDRGTTLVLMATRLGSRTYIESQMLVRCGFVSTEDYVLIGALDGGKFDVTYDKFDHRHSRTKFAAYGYIQDNWDRLETGAVIDVEFILGETAQPKEREIGVGHAST